LLNDFAGFWASEADLDSVVDLGLFRVSFAYQNASKSLNHKDI
jgi:hypothetical protein